MGWYDLQRSLVGWKCEGLSDADAHRSLLPTSPLMTVAGIVVHLRWVEQTWFEALFLGEPDDAQIRCGDVGCGVRHHIRHH